MYYGSGAGGMRARQTPCEHPPGGSTFLREMTPWPVFGNYDAISKIQIRLHQSLRIY